MYKITSCSLHHYINEPIATGLIEPKITQADLGDFKHYKIKLIATSVNETRIFWTWEVELYD